MSQAQWLEMFNSLFSNGVMTGQLNSYVTTTTSGLGVSVASGRALIQGFLARSDAAVALTCATADPTNPRIDRAVLHADLTAHTLTVQLLTGTPGVSPSPPVLTQTASVWEISCYQIRVNALQTTLTGGSLTDERSYSAPNIPAASITDAEMVNQKVNRSGDTMTGTLAAKTTTPGSGLTVNGIDFASGTNVSVHGGSGLDLVLNTSGALIVSATLGISLGNPIITVGSQATAGSFGVSQIVAQAVRTNVTTPGNVNVLTFTPAANGLYRVSGYIRQSNGSNTNITASTSWTDPDSGATNQQFMWGGTLLNAYAVLAGSNDVVLTPMTVFASTGGSIICKWLPSAGTPNDFVTFIIERLA